MTKHIYGTGANRRIHNRNDIRQAGGIVTQFLIDAAVRRLEKQDTCPHGDLTGIPNAPETLYECVCGKVFNEDELDEIEWALED